MFARLLISLLMASCLLPAALAGAENVSPPETVATFDQMPKIVTLPDGTLLAFFHPILGEMHAATARTSRDNGKTWSELETLFTLPEEAGGFGYTLPFIDRAGELHLFLFCDANTGQVRPARGPQPKGLGPLGELDIWQARTTDNRRTWLPPRRIWTGRAGDMQSIIQLKSGRILLPISYYLPRDWSHRGTGFDAFTWRGSFRTSALYSDDGGATWKQSPAALEVPNAAIGDLGAIEPVVLQLKDGRVWMLIRTTVGRFYESFSTDGVEWTRPRPSRIRSSDSPAGLIRLPDGQILLFVNNCERSPYAIGGRQVLHAAISDDSGRTWRGYREVVRDPLRDLPPPPNGDHGASYPYLTLTKDGRVIFTMWVATDTKQRFVYRLDPKWLDETAQADDFTRGLGDWSTFGTQGVEIVSNPESATARALQIRKPSEEWPSGAVWNFPLGGRGMLHCKLRVNSGFAGGLIGLTDHFSPPYDDQDVFYNLFNLKFTQDGRLADAASVTPDRWHDLALDWDCRKRVCRVSLDGKQVAVLAQTRESAGVCYLRLRSTAETTDNSGFLLADVDAHVVPQ